MKISRIYIIIGVMSFALVGLSIVQFFWLKEAIMNNKEKFRNQVHIALNRVVDKLEKQEVVCIAQEHIKQRTYANDQFLITIDSVPEGAHNNNSAITIQQYSPNSNTYQDVYSLPNNNFQMTALSSTHTVHEGEVETYESSQSIQIARKNNLVHFIVNELISVPRPLEERITPFVLDSMLKAELKNQGIQLGFKFGIVHPKKPTRLFHKTSYPQYVENSPYKVHLFPSDLSANLNQLAVYFPEERSYLLQKVLGMFISSFVFISLTIFSFSYAVRTMLRQKKLSEATNDFINNMTHELKTPIATVSLATQALTDPDIQQLPKQRQRYLKIIQEENTRLGNQVEKVLQTARLDQKNFKLKFSDVQVDKVIKTILPNFSIQIENRGGSIQTDLKTQDKVIQADESHITNIISNLLDNANKYSPESPQIVLQTIPEKEGVKIIVSDKGQGISKDKLPKIFDKFYRVPTGNLHDVKGFGLGLSYVKTLVDAHKGSIQVKSEVNKGSSFTLFLPYQQHGESTTVIS